MATFLYPPVSVTTLPPLGGATSANQLIEIAELQDINSELDDQSIYLSLMNTEIGEINTKTPVLVGGKVPVDTGLDQPLTDAELRAAPVPVSGPLTDTQLRATPVPVSVSNFPATQPVSGPLTDAELRAAPVSVTANAGTNLNTSALNLEATQALIKAKTDNLDVLLSTRATNADLLLMSAKLPASLGAKTGANSLSVVPASDAEFTVIQKAPTVVGTDQTQNCNETTGQTFTKPAGAKNMVIFNNAGDPVANRARIGQAPDWATAQGAILGVGNSTALLPASAFKAVAENAESNANVTVLWFY